MRKLFVAVLLLFSLAAAAQERDFSKVQIKVTKVAGTVYMLEGAGGNIGVSVGEDGIVVVDDQFAPLAEKIQAALKGITDKPVRFVINTHWHFDHTGGNAYFQKQGPIIAQENVRERLKTGGEAAGMKIPPAPKEALPIITFNDRATVHLNGEDIRAIHFPHGHTDGDAVIFFPQSNVVHMGDDFVTYGFPFIDLESGGSVRGMIAACEKVMATVPADAKIIPGHGALSTVADMKPFVAMLEDSMARVENGIKQGKTVEQLKQEKVLAGYESWGGPGKFITTDKFIETLYNDLKGNKTGEFIKHN
ncbi:MAG: MBL fold metallo-hydrolase [Acidobacteriia bacterium]|nr:MBL fold metallo-hydrolase [Terriglobia bacterium]